MAIPKLFDLSKRVALVVSIGGFHRLSLSPFKFRRRYSGRTVTRRLPQSGVTVI
jgi:hypothetical protein